MAWIQITRKALSLCACGSARLLFEASRRAVFCMLGSLSGTFPSSQSPKRVSKANSCNLQSVKFGPQRGVDTGQEAVSSACSSGLSHCEASAFQMGSSKKDLLRYNPHPRSVQFSLLTCVALWVSASLLSGAPVTTLTLECFPHSKQGPVFIKQSAHVLSPGRPLPVFYLCLSGHIL